MSAKGKATPPLPPKRNKFSQIPKRTAPAIPFPTFGVKKLKRFTVKHPILSAEIYSVFSKLLSTHSFFILAICYLAACSYHIHKENAAIPTIWATVCKIPVFSHLTALFDDYWSDVHGIIAFIPFLYLLPENNLMYFILSVFYVHSGHDTAPFVYVVQSFCAIVGLRIKNINFRLCVFAFIVFVYWFSYASVKIGGSEKSTNFSKHRDSSSNEH